MIGYEHFRVDGFPWRRIHEAVIPLAMPHVELPLGRWRALKIMLRGRALLLRWEVDFDRPTPAEWWHVIKDGRQDMGDLSSGARNQVRRGMRNFVVEKRSRDYIIEHGHAVYRSAYERYETFEPCLPLEDFRAGIAGLPAETEFWTAHDHAGTFVAFTENLVRDDACFYVTMWFQPEALRKYVSYAMIHVMNEHYLNTAGCRYVTDGSRSVSHDTNVHKFLENRFGFRRAYASLRIAYFPGMRAVVAALYPFRHRLAAVQRPWARKLEALLELERIRRACAQESPERP